MKRILGTMASQAEIKRVVEDHIDMRLRHKFVTDCAGAHNILAKMGHQFEPHKSTPISAAEKLPLAHRAISLAKRFLLGTYHLDEIPRLPTKPMGWKRPHNGPEGDWTIAHGTHKLATLGACEKFGIPEPDFNQLPAIFCVDESGKVEVAYNVTAAQAAAFISARI
jgi:hypothetical protein